MKKLLLIFVATGLLLGCSNEKSFKISGTLNDFGITDEPQMLYLKTRNASEEMVNIDSTLMKASGAFVLKGKTLETDLFFLADKDNVFFLRIFVDPGNQVKVSGSATEPQNILIEGSESQVLYQEYISLMTPIYEKQEQINQEYTSYVYGGASEEELQALEEILTVSYYQLEEEVKTTTQEFINSNNNHIVAAYLVYRNASSLSNSEEVEEQLQWLNPEMDNKFVALIKKRIENIKLTEVGSVLPNIELPNPEGVLLSLETLRGKYVLVDFWASWCRPCVEEIPNLKKAYLNFHDKGFEIISISLDQDRNAWLAAIKNHEINWLNAIEAEGSPHARQMGVNYIPHTFLLDPQGVIIAVNLRGEELARKLSEIIK